MTKLTGINVLVTRPAHQSEHLCQLIEAAGGQPVRLPVIEIVESDDKSALFDCRARLDELDIAIFISANAVEKALPTLLAQRGLPAQLQLVAVGKRTAETLKAWALTTLCPAPPFNSEAMLAMPQMQPAAVQRKQIVIFRGEGGRELLAETLRQRGATVNYINVYRRVQPPTPAWINDTQIDILTVTSVEGLHNLFTMLDGQAWLRHTPLVVMSERVRSEAQKLGVSAPILVAPTASDEGLLSAVQQAAI
ncbi:MAG: uroporphyrinogen-III synthase [Candidatus Parabeggiatoa sp. nov. 1]|nr:MAG: uroporphyrinogen-III synthase [Gammaproteobacteria bacterium]